MLLRILLLLVTNLALSTQQQTAGTPLSPCPNVFAYESTSSEPGRWYGVANLSTDSTLHSLWLNIVLDSKADILGNWIGDVTTTDNIDFKIENTKMKLQPGPATAVRFFVQYNPLNKPPKLQAIRLNGREICNANNPLPAVGRPESDRPDIDRPIKVKPRPDSSVSRPDISVDTPIDRPIARPESSRPEHSRPESSRPGSSRPESARPESSLPDYSRPETSRPESSRPDYSRPESSRPEYSRPDDSITHTVIGAEERPYSRPVQGRPTTSGSPIYVPTQNPPFEESNANPYSIGDGNQHPSQSVGASESRPTRPDYRVTTLRTTTRAPTSRPYDEEDFVDTDESKPGDGNEYFEGGLVTIVTGNNNNNHNSYDQNYNNNKGQQHETCGQVIRNAEPNPLVVNGRPTLEGQWPWQIALYQTQTVDNKYICGGTLVSHKHIITAAHCVARKSSNRVVNKNTLTIYLGKHNLRTSVDGVQIRLVGEIHIHPSYNASSFSNDLAILTLREPVHFSDWVQPACLWPDSQSDLSNVIGKKGSVVGWGFDDKGVATEELTLVEMPVVDQETCIRSYSEFFARFTSDHTYCAGYRDGQFDRRSGSVKSTSVCNGDSGGGMVFNTQGHWYLRGLVSLSVARQNEYRCDPTHYVVFTDLAKFSSWIKQYVN